MPENIREGVHIKGGGVDVVGTLTYKNLLPDVLTIQNGNLIDPLVGGGVTLGKNMSLTSAGIVSSNGTAESGWYFPRPIPGTDFQRVYFHVQVSWCGRTDAYFSVGVGPGNNSNVFTTSKGTGYGAAPGIISVDIPTSGNHYIKAYDFTVGTFTVAKVTLEKRQ